jgi:5-methylcytosine-specific restriction endonuclease McrBC GTP-binding regulatory subunit McrB
MIAPIQRILFGSPGTGKSYRIDNEIIPYELSIDKDETPENIIKAVFHPEYTHGDFMGKLVPITKDGKVHYNFYEGHFLKALSRSYKNILEEKLNNSSRTNNVTLIIDEINRGNSSAIFGPIFQLLDRDNQGWSDYYINITDVIFEKILNLIDVEPVKVGKELKGYQFQGRKAEIEDFKSIGFDILNKSIKIPCNLSIIATMNTSDSSIYYMDSAFKRRWEWEFIDVTSKSVKEEGLAFNSREEWRKFAEKLNKFIRDRRKYIRGIEDKQVGEWFIKDDHVTNATIQNKLMFFIWDSVFSRDKKPLVHLLYGEDEKYQDKLVTFGDFAKEVKLFIEKIKGYV